MSATLTRQNRCTIRIFIVDDVAEIRELFRAALDRDPQMEVVGEAGDGIAAVAGLDACRPDAVLLDLAMPRMDGLEALPQIRALLPRAVIAAISGFRGATMRPRATGLGADLYIEKGTPATEIIEVVRHAVAHRRDASRSETGYDD